jgi:hypothetical protein
MRGIGYVVRPARRDPTRTRRGNLRDGMNGGILAKPLRGISIRERLRIMRLARSGREISDPDDAQRVEAYLQSELSTAADRAWRWGLLIVLFWVALVVWWTTIGPDFASGGAIASTGVLLGWLAGVGWKRSRYKATARANDWEV